MNILKTEFVGEAIDLAKDIRNIFLNEDMLTLEKINNVICHLYNKLNTKIPITVYDQDILNEYTVFTQYKEGLYLVNKTINQLLFLDEYKIAKTMSAYEVAKSFLNNLQSLIMLNEKNSKVYKKNINKYLVMQIFSSYKKHIIDVEKSVITSDELLESEKIFINKNTVDLNEAIRTLENLNAIANLNEQINAKLNEIENLRIKIIAYDYFTDQTRTDDTDSYRESYEENNNID